MSIVQTNLWTCELCGRTESTSEEVDVYSDPTVLPPPGRKWGHTGDGDKLACPECLAKPAATAPIDPDAIEWHRRNDAQALRLQIQEQSRGFMPERGGYRGQ